VGGEKGISLKTAERKCLGPRGKGARNKGVGPSVYGEGREKEEGRLRLLRGLSRSRRWGF